MLLWAIFSIDRGPRRYRRDPGGGKCSRRSIHPFPSLWGARDAHTILHRNGSIAVERMGRPLCSQRRSYSPLSTSRRKYFTWRDRGGGSVYRGVEMGRRRFVGACHDLSSGYSSPVPMVSEDGSHKALFLTSWSYDILIMAYKKCDKSFEWYHIISKNDSPTSSAVLTDICIQGTLIVRCFLLVRWLEVITPAWLFHGHTFSH